MEVRNPEKLQVSHSALEIITGDVSDAEAIHHFINGCDVVVRALGLGQPANEKTIFTQSTGNIIKTMNNLSLKRYIVLTGINVDAPFDEKDAKTKFSTQWMYDNYPVSTADKQWKYEMLAKSNLNWTMIRLPLVMQSEEQTVIGKSLVNCVGDQVNAANIAKFIIDQPFIWNS